MMDSDCDMTSPDVKISPGCLNGSRNYMKKQRYKIQGNVKFFPLPYLSSMIVLMDHPSSFTVYGYVSIQALSGSISVLGYEIKPRSKPLEVFSSEKTGLIEIKSETFECIWKKKNIHEDLVQLFNNFTRKDTLTLNILEQLGNSCVALFVKHITFPAELQFLEMYYPHPLSFNLRDKKDSKLYIDKCNMIPIRFDDDVEEIIARIGTLLRIQRLTEYDAPRVVVCGHKNTGKSSLIRFLINKVLSAYLVAYYLDTDPGQTEFTPPGVVSLTKVTKPIIGPPFCHQRDPLLMIFTGSVSPSSPDMYAKSISKLMDHYEKYKDEPLFVNTMGWMEGFGLHCLGNVLARVKPNVVIEIVSEDEISFFDYRNYVSEDGFFVQIPCRFKQKTPAIPAKEMRELTLLSYFGKCQSPFLGPMPLNEIRPYCVCWDSIPVYICHQKIQPFRIIEAVSHSIVALCVVPETVILKSDIPQFPITLDDEPENECIGFGLVRAVDETAHLLYIITPLKMDDLKKVNAIIKGNIVIPDALILKQDIFGEPLPYTYERKETPPPKEDEQDYCSVSLTPKPDTNAKSPVNTTPHASANSYRKSVPKRFNRPRR